MMQDPGIRDPRMPGGRAGAGSGEGLPALSGRTTWRALPGEHYLESTVTSFGSSKIDSGEITGSSRGRCSPKRWWSLA